MRASRPLLFTLVFATLVAIPSLASAQYADPPPPPGYGPPPSPGYGPPPPPPAYEGGFAYRHGLTLGFSITAGAMDSDTGAIECFDCAGEPLAGSASLHIGGMLSPRLALLLELMAVSKSLDSAGYNRLDQSMASIVGRYWVSPRLWIQGGLGMSHLSVSYDDGFAVGERPVADGGAFTAGVGFEALSGPRFAVDIQLRAAIGFYESLDVGDQIQSLTVGAGFSWF